MTQDTPKQPRPGDRTPNALTAETLRKTAAGIDVFKVDGGVDELMASLLSNDQNQPADSGR